MSAHRYDRESGGCVCGSEWSRYWYTCITQVDDFGRAWLEAQEHWTVAAYADMDSEPWDCSHGHHRCTRH